MVHVPMTRVHLDRLCQCHLGDVDRDQLLCLRFLAGETVLREGMPITFLALVVSGKAKVCATAPNGRQLTLCYYLSRGMVGDIEFMAGLKAANATLIAVTDFELIALPYDAYGAALRQNVGFMNALASHMAEKFVTCSNSFVSAALNTARERLCAYILRRAQGGLFCDVLTEAAVALGMSYRHMLRLLSDLCKEGVLQKRGGAYVIVDGEALSA